VTQRDKIARIGFEGRIVLLALLAAVTLLASCGGTAGGARAPQSAGANRKTIVVTYAILGALVKDLAGDAADVVVPMPNGQDPHEWEPSARDIETIMKADLIVQNGLGLEGGMEKTLDQARRAGVRFFTASDHIAIRRVGAGEGIPTGDPDQAAGAEDPHLWMDPLDMKAVVTALAAQLKTDLAIDRSAQAAELAGELDDLNAEIAGKVGALPEADRKLVTGHESLGYFAQRYGLKLVGALIPSITSQADVSASDLAALKRQIQANGVKAVFTELGTPSAVATAIGAETGANVVELPTHALPADGSYFSFMRNLADTIVGALK